MDCKICKKDFQIYGDRDKGICDECVIDLLMMAPPPLESRDWTHPNGCPNAFISLIVQGIKINVHCSRKAKG